MITATSGTRELRHRLDGAGDRLGLAALLGADPRIRARRVDQRDHGQAEALGQLHQPHRLAIALGAGHAEVVTERGWRCRSPFSWPISDHRATTETGEAALDRGIVAERPVTGQRHEIVEQRRDIV